MFLKEATLDKFLETDRRLAIVHDMSFNETSKLKIKFSGLVETPAFSFDPFAAPWEAIKISRDSDSKRRFIKNLVSNS